MTDDSKFAESPEVLTAYLTALSEMAILTDGQGNIKAANKSWLEYLATDDRLKLLPKLDNFLVLVEKGLIVQADSDMSELLSAFSTVCEGRSESVSKTSQHLSENRWQWLVIRFSKLRLGQQFLVLIRLEHLKAPLAGENDDEVVPDLLYKSLLDDLPILLNICDRDMRYVWVNRSFREQFNIRPTDVVGKKAHEISGLRDFDRMQQLRQQCFDTGQEQTEIITLVFKGREVILDVRYIPVLRKDGSVEYVIGANRDITKQVQSQNSRSAAHDLLNDVLERMPVGFIAADNHFHILRANDTACKLFGYDKEDLVGQHVNVLMPTYFHEAHNKHMADFAASGATSSTMDARREIYAQRCDGVVFPIMASILRMSLGDFPLYCVMIVDLSKIRDAEQRLVETELGIQQMQKQEALGQLAGNIAHDFNNLMAIVLGYADMIQGSEGMPDGVVEMMAEIKKAVQRGAGLTGQILAYAKHQALEVKPTDMHVFLRENLAMIQAALTANVKCVLNLGAKALFVDIDENQFMQVLINLAVNARDAMPSGGEFTITTNPVYLDEEYFKTRAIQPQVGAYVYITIADTGTGIPKEILQRIFDPYFSTKSRDKGTGLGLSVVYGIIKQHRGLIFCDSTPNVGTVFEIFLPVSMQKSSDAPSGLKENRMPEEELMYAQKHILVVDDEDALRKLVVTQVASLGLQVHAAANGREALDFIDMFPGKLDIILTDIMMPEMTGLEMAEEAQLMQPEAAFIFMSGYSKELLKTKNPRENFRLLTKPFKKEALFEEIRKVLLVQRGTDNA